MFYFILSEVASKLLGCVGGIKEYPVTLAPSSLSHIDSQEPLNPVCPVTRTFFPLNIFFKSVIVILFAPCKEDGV